MSSSEIGLLSHYVGSNICTPIVNMYSIIRMNSNNNNNIVSIYKIVDACMSVSAVHVSNTYIWNGNTLTIEQLCKRIHGEEKGFYSKRNNVESYKHFTHSQLLMISWISNKKQFFFLFFFFKFVIYYSMKLSPWILIFYGKHSNHFYISKIYEVRTHITSTRIQQPI